MLISGAAIAAFLLGLLPIFHHLIFGLRERRCEILYLLDDNTIGLYFDQFYRSRAPKLKEHAAEEFTRIYDHRFGLRTYLLPLAVYIPVLAITIFVVAWTAASGRVPFAMPEAIVDPTACYALAGAYLWVVFDLIGRYRQRNLVPSSVYWGAFRMVIAIPLALSIAALLKESVAPTFAFLLGAFPTTTLLLVIRRRVSPTLGLGDESAEDKHELERLQGVNKTTAETFSDIGVSTLVQIAYEDPVQLAMRSNLSFYFVLDVISQALAAIYLDLAEAQKYSIRGAIEASLIVADLNQDSGTDFDNAKIIVAALAKDLGIPEAALLVMLYQISEDPCTLFLSAIWDNTPESGACTKA